MTEASSNSATPESYVDFWQARYESGQITWDLNGPSPHFARFLATENPTEPPGAMAVVGAGRGHDAALFARHGYRVTGFDYAPGAVEAANALYGDVATFIQADIFALPERYTAAFDAVLEHTCFCAINPRRRDDYVQSVLRLLRPGGRLIGVFWEHGEPGGPPFSTTAAEITERFSPWFAIERLEAGPQTAAGRLGTEWFAVLRKK